MNYPAEIEIAKIRNSKLTCNIKQIEYEKNLKIFSSSHSYSNCTINRSFYYHQKTGQPSFRNE